MTEVHLGHNQSSLSRSLHIQIRVVGALLMREIITRYGRHNLGFAWLFLEPMLFTFGVTALWYFSHRVNFHGLDISIIAFTITGYGTVLLWRNTTNKCGSAIEPNAALLHHRNVTVSDLFVARIILEVAGATMSFIFVALLFTGLDLIKPPANLLRVALGWLLLACFAASLGLIVGVLQNKSEIFERIWHTATYLMLPLSGAFFMVDWLPKSMQEIVVWVPLVNAAEMIRHGYFGDIIKTYEDPAYMITVNMVCMLIGLMAVRNADSH